MAQLIVSAVGAVVGGVVGYFVGGPAGVAEGAEIGWALGGVAGALLIHQKGPQPGDLRVQDSAYGRPIPVLYGMYRAAGNVIWAGQPTVESGGKGSAPSQAKVQMSFAVAICRGPITGVRRIWANGKLIYDISNPSNFEAISGSAQMTTGFSLYPGDELQTADPTMEAALGIGNVPAYRGLAYVVFNNLDLSPWGNYMPSLSFEITTTQPTQSYCQNMTTWPGSNMIGMMPNLKAAGTVLTYFNYNTFYDGVHSAQMTPYGSNVYGVANLPPDRPTGTGPQADGTSDVDGLLALDSNGKIVWYDGYSAVISYTGYAGGVTSFVRNLTDLYVTDGTSITYCSVSLDPLGGIINGVSPVTGTHLAIVGLTASYLYVTDYSVNKLYVLHRNSMTIAATLVNTFFDVNLTVGCVLNDDFLYFLKAGATHFYEYDTRTNVATVIGEWTATVGVSTQSLKAISRQFFIMGSLTYTAGAYLGYLWLGDNANDIALSSIVADICNQAGLSPSQYDVSQLTDRVNGYGITNHSTARANLTPLMATYFFDVCDTDGILKFVRRGSQPIAAIAYGDLGASTSLGDATNENPVTEIIAQEIDLPRTLAFSYTTLNNDYQVNTQRAFRQGTRSNKDMTMGAPIVLSDDVGLMRAQVMLWAAWVGQTSFTFSTPLSYLEYEPGDVLTLPGDNGQIYTIRLIRCTYDGQGTLQWTASREEPDIYPSAAYNVQGGAPSGFTPQQIDYSGPTILVVLDVPPLRDTDTVQGVYLAACGFASNWPGAVVDISRDGTSYADLAQIVNSSVIGNTSGVLPNFFGGNQPDELSTVSVSVYGGALASVSYANFMAGVNAAYIGGELVYFRNAVQTGANTYTLSGFLRGRAGTEWAMGSHVNGEQFVFLDSTKVKSVNLNVTDVGSKLYFEPHLMNIFANQAVSPITLTPSNLRLKPLSPALFVAGHGSASSTSDISLSWFRRARVHGQWNDGADVPLDESAETYTLNIYSGSTLKRTVTVSSATNYTYTAANITADGFSSGNTITFTVAQNSDQGVLGYAATTTITR